MGECCSVVADGQRVSADTLNELFFLPMLLQQIVSVDRWLQVLQSFKELDIFFPDLVIMPLGSLNI